MSESVWADPAVYVDAADSGEGLTAPAYFADFIGHAEQHGLQFLSEARLVDVIVPQVKPEARMALSELSWNDLVAYQQYLDFVRFRKFRQTLLCHREIHLRRDGFHSGLDACSWLRS